MIIRSGKNKFFLILLLSVFILVVIGVLTNIFSGSIFGIEKKVDVFSVQNNNERKAMNEMYKFYLEWDKTMAEVFNINMGNYRKIDTLVGFMTSEYDELNIGDIRVQIPLKYGDTTPSVYINKENSAGIAATQGIDGLYTLYEFEKSKDKYSRYNWEITKTFEVWGERKFVNEEQKEYFKKRMNNHP
jgi:hypothetical protein